MSKKKETSEAPPPPPPPPKRIIREDIGSGGEKRNQVGIVLGWNVLPQPAWAKALYDKVMAKIKKQQ